jgi:predicted phosphodiesterase
MLLGHVHETNFTSIKKYTLYYFNFGEMDSPEQETRFMACLRQKLNYVKTNKFDEESS